MRDGTMKGQRLAAWSVAIWVAVALQAFGGVSEHVFSVEIWQGWDYDRPQDPLHYELDIGIETDATVKLVEFLSPAGNTFSIAKLALDNPAPGVETEWTVDGETGHYWWTYGSEFSDPGSLADYGDGDYTITVHYNDDTTEQTTVWFGTPGTTDPILQPTQEPIVLTPSHDGTVTSPAIFAWKPCTDPAATQIWIEIIRDELYDQAHESVLPVSATSYGPLELTPSTSTEIEVYFETEHSGTNADGVDFCVGKESTSDYYFEVTVRDAGTIAVGETAYGVISGTKEIDTYMFMAAAGQALVVDVDARALWADLDSSIVVRGPDGSVIGRDDDSGDCAGAFLVEFGLEALRTGNDGTPGYSFWCETWSEDSRLYFTAPQNGLYAIEVGSYDNLVEGGDGDFGPNAIYQLRLLDASSLPLVSATATLTKPGGGVEALTPGAETGMWPGLYYSRSEGEDTLAALVARFPDGEYTIRVDYGSGDVRERLFVFGGDWPDFPVVTAPTNGANGVAKPVNMTWEQVTTADWIGIDLYGPDDLADGFWYGEYAASATSGVLPADQMGEGTTYEAEVGAYTGGEQAPGISVEKGRLTRGEFTTAAPGAAYKAYFDFDTYYHLGPGVDLFESGTYAIYPAWWLGLENDSDAPVTVGTVTFDSVYTLDNLFPPPDASSGNQHTWNDVVIPAHDDVDIEAFQSSREVDAEIPMNVTRAWSPRVLTESGDVTVTVTVTPEAGARGQTWDEVYVEVGLHGMIGDGEPEGGTPFATLSRPPQYETHSAGFWDGGYSTATSQGAEWGVFSPGDGQPIVFTFTVHYELEDGVGPIAVEPFVGVGGSLVADAGTEVWTGGGLDLGLENGTVQLSTTPAATGDHLPWLGVEFHSSAAVVATEDSAILGSWWTGSNSADGVLNLTFYENGFYVHYEYGISNDPENNGVEYGTYAYDAATGQMTTSVIKDENGDFGLSDWDPNTVGGSTPADTFTIFGDTMVIVDGDETFTLFRVTSDSVPIVGSWRGGPNTEDDVLSLTFYPNDFYVHYEYSVSSDPENNGVEYGTYAYDASTGQMTVSVIEDENGDYGISDWDPDNVGASTPAHTLTIAGDVMTIVDDNGTDQLLRVPSDSPGDPVLSDDFDDNAKGEMWYLVENAPDLSWLDETNGQLEARATGAAADELGAHYASRGWRLSTDSNFSLQTEWTFPLGAGVDWSSIYLEIKPGITTNDESVIIETYAAAGAKWQRAGVERENDEVFYSASRTVDSGTFYVSYEAAADKLYLSINGYWIDEHDPANGNWIVEGQLKGQWGVDTVAIWLSTDLEYAVASGVAYFDDFAVTEGTVAMPATKQLTVNSNASVMVEVRPDDNGSLGDGATPFIRTYDVGIPVFLTAPADDGQGNAFVKWLVDGEEGGTDLSIGLAMDVDHSVMAVYQVAGSLSDHVFSVEIWNSWDYDQPQYPLTYEFGLEVETDAAVSLIEFLSPAGNTFSIPDLDYGQPESYVETGRELDDGTGHYWWYYETWFPSESSLAPYGDGQYSITVHFADGTQSQTTVWFGIPETSDPIPQPTQEPVVLAPQHNDTVTNPVLFTWEPCVDPAATRIVTDVFSDTLDEGEKRVFGTTVTSDTQSGLTPDSDWEIELEFGAGYSGTNAEGIGYSVRKYSQSDTSFIVAERTPGTIAIGETVNGVISTPQEVDTYTFEATAGQSLVVDVNARALWADLDPLITVVGPDGIWSVSDDDGGDIAGAFQVEFELTQRRRGGTGTPEYAYYVEAWCEDSRLYFTAPSTGTYRVEIGDYEFIDEGKDGKYGPESFYELRLLPASALPPVDGSGMTMTLHKPGGGTEAIPWEGGFEFFSSGPATSTSDLTTRFPDGEYRVTAEMGPTMVAERSFVLGGDWVSIPVVTAPVDAATDVQEPANVTWQPVANADWIGLGLYLPDDLGDEVWDAGYGPSATSAVIPAVQTEAGTTYHAELGASTGGDEGLGLYVRKSSVTWFEFATSADISSDDDGDGLPDAWESARFGNLDQAGWMDPDGDGLINRKEFLAGTDPLNRDTDADGFRDLAEILIGGDPLNAAVPARDVTITGTVYEGTSRAPLANTVVAAVLIACPHAPTLCMSGPPTNETGVYSLTIPAGVEVALFAVHINAMMPVPVAPFYLSEFIPGVADPWSATHFLSTFPGTIDGADFELKPAGLIMGTATNVADDSPISSLPVDVYTAEEDPRPLNRSRTNTNGTYRLMVPVGVDCTVQAGGEWFRTQYYDGVTDAGSAEVFNLAANEIVVDTDFSLEFRDEVADYVSGIEILQGLDYDVPGGASEYTLSVSVEAGPAVEEVAFSKQGDVEVHVISREDAGFRGEETWYECRPFRDAEWGYEVWGGLEDVVTPFGDGVYDFTFYLADGRQRTTSVGFAVPGGGGAIAQPTDMPMITVPEHNSTVTSPVTFEWDACTDPNATMIHINVENLSTEQDVFSENLGKTETAHGPVVLEPGAYEFDVDFGNVYDSVNDDGIPTMVGKYSERDHEFTVQGTVADYLFDIEILIGKAQWHATEPVIEFAEVMVETSAVVAQLTVTTPDGTVLDIPLVSESTEGREWGMMVHAGDGTDVFSLFTGGSYTVSALDDTQTELASTSVMFKRSDGVTDLLAPTQVPELSTPMPNTAHVLEAGPGVTFQWGSVDTAADPQTTHVSFYVEPLFGMLNDDEIELRRTVAEDNTATNSLVPGVELPNGVFTADLAFADAHQGVTAEGVDFLVARTSEAHYRLIVSDAEAVGADKIQGIDLWRGSTLTVDRSGAAIHGFEAEVKTTFDVVMVELVSPMEHHVTFPASERYMDNGLYTWEFDEYGDASVLGRFGTGIYAIRITYTSTPGVMEEFVTHVVFANEDFTSLPMPGAAPSISAPADGATVVSPFDVVWDAWNTQAPAYLHPGAGIWYGAYTTMEDNEVAEGVLDKDATQVTLGLADGTYLVELEFFLARQGDNADDIAFSVTNAAGAERHVTVFEAQALLEDDFEDNTKGDMWYLIEDDPDNVWFAEDNGRLEARATAAMSYANATYISRKWRLSAHANFAMQVDWHYASTAAECGLYFGLQIPDAGESFLNLNVDYDDGAPSFYVDAATNGMELYDETIARVDTGGTFYVSYDAASGRTHLSTNGYWRTENVAAGDWVFDGVLRGTWGVDAVAVDLGFYDDGDGAPFASGDAWYDNFKVTQGTIVPPPAHTLALSSVPNAGVAIEVRPEDNGDLGNGSAPFSRTYDEGIPVFLTAPADDGQGNAFLGWRLDGSDAGSEPQIELVMDVDHAFVAVYEGAAPPLTVSPTPETASPIALVEGGSQVLSVVVSGGTPGYAYAWSLDGMPIAGANGTQYIYEPDFEAVAHPAQSASKMLVCVVTDFAGARETLAATWTLNVSDVDQEPVGPVVEINPTAPTTVDELSVTRLVDATDPDGDAISYVTTWTLLGGRTTVVSSTLPAAETLKGQTWEVEVAVVTDPYGSGPEVAQDVGIDTVTIGNTAPVAELVSGGATLKNEATTIVLGGIDPDMVDGVDALTFAVVTYPEHGTLSSPPPGSSAYVYEPDPDYTGPDSIEVEADDGTETSPVLLVPIVVLDNLIVLSLTGASVGQLEFGVQDGATPAVDRGIDHSMPPPPPSGGPGEALLLAPEGDAATERLQRDVRSSFAGETWQIEAHAVVGVDIVITWDPQTLPQEHELWMWRVDKRDGTMIPGTAAAMTEITFLTIPGGEERYYAIRASASSDLVLGAGWNLISLPLAPLEPAVERVFDAENFTASDGSRGTIYTDSIWAWNTANGLYEAVTTMAPKVGCWIYVDTAGTLRVHGSPVASNEVPLLGGWNAVGVVVPTMLAEGPSTFLPAWVWSAVEQMYRPLHAGDVALAGVGFWIYALEGTELVPEQ